MSNYVRILFHTDSQAALAVFFIVIISFVYALSLISLTHSMAAKVYGDRIVVATIKGTIDGAMEDYIKSAINYASSKNAILIIKLDTPGGWVSNALEIVGEIENSPIPVIGYVDGKWAMSAGTLILMCSHVAAMKPGAIIGAVQPVAFNPSTGSYTPVNESKIVNPIIGKLSACIRLRLESLGASEDKINRVVKEAVRMVKENKVFGASEAEKEGVVDIVAKDLHNLLSEINGTKYERLGRTFVISIPPNPNIEYYYMPMGLRVAHFLSDPVISGLLSSIGILVILAALFTGHIYAIVLGVALILLSLLGMGYSASLVGIVLIIIGLTLLIVELALIPGFGIVGATGIGLLVIGLIMLPTGGGPINISAEYLQRVAYIVAGVSAPIAGIMGIIIYKALRIWRKKPVYQPTVIGKTGKAIDEIPENNEGFVLIEGEYWRARALRYVRKGAKVRVVGKEGPILLVTPIEEHSE